MEKLYYYRVRDRWAEGPGEWSFHDALVYGDDNFSTIIEDVSERHNARYAYEDGYRGCDCEEISEPPWSWIHKEIQNSKRVIINTQARVERLEKLQLYLIRRDSNGSEKSNG